MAPTTRKKSGGDLQERTIEGVVESPLNRVPAYIDTACHIDKIVKLTWAEIYRSFARKETEVPQDEEDHQVYFKVKKSWFHKVATHMTIFSCAEIVEWIVQHVDENYTIVKNDPGEAIVAYTTFDITKYYRSPVNFRRCSMLDAPLLLSPISNNNHISKKVKC